MSVVRAGHRDHTPGGRSAVKRCHFDDLKTARERQDVGSDTDTDSESSDEGEQESSGSREATTDIHTEQSNNLP